MELTERTHPQAASALGAGEARWHRRPLRGAVAGVQREVAPLVVALLFFFPFLIMVTTSFKAEDDVFRFPPKLWPEQWVRTNYDRVFEAMPFWRYLGNTLFLSLVAVVGALISCPLVAYSLAKVPWRGRNLLFVVVLSTMMLPPQVTMIPVYLMWNELNLVGTYWPLVTPNFLGTAFFIFLLRQFFRGIPNDLLEGARSDGAGE